MNVDIIGRSYDIASDYLRRSGAISDSATTNDALLQTIVQMFHRGETNVIRLANRAIAKFESAQLAA
ncbi:hypothetical protein [Rhodopseudomonas palustris]